MNDLTPSLQDMIDDDTTREWMEFGLTVLLCMSKLKPLSQDDVQKAHHSALELIEFFNKPAEPNGCNHE